MEFLDSFLLSKQWLAPWPSTINFKKRLFSVIPFL